MFNLIWYSSFNRHEPCMCPIGPLLHVIHVLQWLFKLEYHCHLTMIGRVDRVITLSNNIKWQSLSVCLKKNALFSWHNKYCTGNIVMFSRLISKSLLVYFYSNHMVLLNLSTFIPFDFKLFNLIWHFACNIS